MVDLRDKITEYTVIATTTIAALVAAAVATAEKEEIKVTLSNCIINILKRYS